MKPFAVPFVGTNQAEAHPWMGGTEKHRNDTLRHLAGSSGGGI